jgi:hypothetical protein
MIECRAPSSIDFEAGLPNRVGDDTLAAVRG